jgi:hypothetical protein
MIHQSWFDRHLAAGTCARPAWGSSFGLVALLEQAVAEQVSEVERRLEAVRRRREFRLIQGTKL